MSQVTYLGQGWYALAVRFLSIAPPWGGGGGGGGLLSLLIGLCAWFSRPPALFEFCVSHRLFGQWAWLGLDLEVAGSSPG